MKRVYPYGATLDIECRVKDMTAALILKRSLQLAFQNKPNDLRKSIISTLKISLLAN